MDCTVLQRREHMRALLHSPRCDRSQGGGAERGACDSPTSGAPGEDFLAMVTGLVRAEGAAVRRAVACRARKAQSPAAERAARWYQYVGTRCACCASPRLLHPAASCGACDVAPALGRVNIAAGAQREQSLESGTACPAPPRSR